MTGRGRWCNRDPTTAEKWAERDRLTTDRIAAG
jgi:hypothetical protein